MPSHRAAVRVLFRGDACQTDGFRTCTMVGTYGRFGLSIVNPTKGAAKRCESLSAPRAAISARGPRGQRLPQVSPRACGMIPTSPFF